MASNVLIKKNWRHLRLLKLDPNSHQLTNEWHELQVETAPNLCPEQFPLFHTTSNKLRKLKDRYKKLFCHLNPLNYWAIWLAIYFHSRIKAYLWCTLIGAGDPAQMIPSQNIGPGLHQQFQSPNLGNRAHQHWGHSSSPTPSQLQRPSMWMSLVVEAKEGYVSILWQWEAPKYASHW